MQYIYLKKTFDKLNKLEQTGLTLRMSLALYHHSVDHLSNLTKELELIVALT